MRRKTEASQRLLLRTPDHQRLGAGETIQLFEPHLNTALPHVKRSRVSRSRQVMAKRVGSLRWYVVCCMLLRCRVSCTQCVRRRACCVCAQVWCVVNVAYALSRVSCMSFVFFIMSPKNTPMTHRKKHPTAHRTHTENIPLKYRKTKTYFSNTAFEKSTIPQKHNIPHNMQGPPAVQFAQKGPPVLGCATKHWPSVKLSRQCGTAATVVRWTVLHSVPESPTRGRDRAVRALKKQKCGGLEMPQPMVDRRKGQWLYNAHR